MGYKIGFWLLVIFFIAYAFKKQAQINHIYIEQKKSDSIKLYNIKFVKETNDSLCKYWDEKNWAE